MKKTALLLCFMIMPLIAMAQQPSVYTGKVYKAEDIKIRPNYQNGGEKGFYTYFNKNFRIPDIDKNFTAKIVISFIVETDGTLGNIKIVKDPGDGLGIEALRVITNCPGKWDAAVLDGKKVRFEFLMPININVSGS